MLENKLSINHLIREPLKKTNTPPPLLLLIHGYGSNEEDLMNVSKEFPAEFFIISLQAPYQVDFGRYAWFSIDFFEEKKTYNIRQAISSLELISLFITQAISYYNLNETNVWLCGFSQGAILSYALALNYPKKINKIIALSGFLSKELIKMGKEPNIYSHLEFFISHGQQDDIIPIEWVKDTLKFLTNYKVSYLYQVYKAGHQINQENYIDLLTWINSKL